MKTIAKKIEDIYLYKGHYKYLYSRIIACEKLDRYMEAVAASGELFDPYYTKLMDIVTNRTHQEWDDLQYYLDYLNDIMGHQETAQEIDSRVYPWL